MPSILASLLQLPQLLDEIMYRGALRVQSALQEMHAVSLLHADVKNDNMVLNIADMWHLAGHGACVEFGQPIMSCTEACTPTTYCFASQFLRVGQAYLAYALVLHHITL